MGVQAANAIKFAHEEGVVHRDIRPAHLLLDQSAKVHVTDFGLARIKNREDLTLTGDLIGTLRYMSPEQLSGSSIADQRTDVYSLGLTLYELAVGQPAISDDNRADLAQAIKDRMPRRLRQLDPTAPQDLDTVILKAISKDPVERYPSAGEFEQDLKRFLDLHPILARRPSRARYVWKWCLINPLFAISLFSTVLVGLLATTWQLRRAIVAQDRSANEVFVSNTDLAYQA